MPLLEVCAGSLASVERAVSGGARRIELCSALPLDGLTPSAGVLRVVRERFPQLTVHVLVRPRAGNFVYSALELESMERDIVEALPWVDGVVSGALTAEGDIDVAATRRLLAAAQNRPFTFHRAFDVCRDPFAALEQLIALGCARVLTSGQQATAVQGLPMLQRLMQQAQGRIIIMPAAGINAGNAYQIFQATQCCELHASASAGSHDTQAHEVASIIQSLA